LSLFVLVWPQLRAGSLWHRELIAPLSLIGGSFSWALGSVLSTRWQSGMDVFSATGWQVVAAGVGNFLFAFVVEDTRRGQGRVRRAGQRDLTITAMALPD